MYYEIEVDRSKHAVSALDNMEEMKRQQTLCDFIIKLDTEEIHVHRLVLASASDYFRSMLTCNMKESQSGFVNMADLDIECIKTCIQFIYNKEVKIAVEKCEDLLYVANMMQLKKLCDHIYTKLAKELNSQSFFATERVADIYGCKELEEKCQKFARENLVSISKEEGFKDLGMEYVRNIIMSKNLKMTEKEKLDVILRFVKVKKRRKKNLEMMIEWVDLSKVPIEHRKNIMEKELLIRNNLKIYKIFTASAWNTFQLKLESNEDGGQTEKVVENDTAVNGSYDMQTMRSTLPTFSPKSVFPGAAREIGLKTPSPMAPSPSAPQFGEANRGFGNARVKNSFSFTTASTTNTFKLGKTGEDQARKPYQGNTAADVSHDQQRPFSFSKPLSLSSTSETGTTSLFATHSATAHPEPNNFVRKPFDFKPFSTPNFEFSSGPRTVTGSSSTTQFGKANDDSDNALFKTPFEFKAASATNTFKLGKTGEDQARKPHQHNTAANASHDQQNPLSLSRPFSFSSSSENGKTPSFTTHISADHGEPINFGRKPFNFKPFSTGASTFQFSSSSRTASAPAFTAQLGTANKESFTNFSKNNSTFGFGSPSASNMFETREKVEAQANETVKIKSSTTVNDSPFAFTGRPTTDTYHSSARQFETGHCKSAIVLFDDESEKLLRFNPRDNMLAQMKDMFDEMKKYTYAAVAVDDYLCVLNGQKFHRFKYADPTSPWEQMPDMISYHGSCPPVTASKGCMFVCGGSGSYTTSAAFERFDLKEMQWKRLADLPRASTDSAVVVCDENLYSIGGRTKIGIVNRVQRFNITSSTWTEVAPMMYKREHAAAVEANGRVFVLGGREDRMSKQDKVERYCVFSDQWMEVKPMKIDRYNFNAFAFDGAIYAVGGSQPKARRTIEKYEVEKDEWEIVELPATTEREVVIARSVVQKIHKCFALQISAIVIIFTNQ